MNIRNRLKKMEAEIIPDSNICVCPDALSLIATPYHRVCYLCYKPIELSAWANWQTIHPTEETNFFAFGMRRDDKNELADKPFDYFKPELSAVRGLMEYEIWLKTLTKDELLAERKATIEELAREKVFTKAELKKLHGSKPDPAIEKKLLEMTRKCLIQQRKGETL